MRKAYSFLEIVIILAVVSILISVVLYAQKIKYFSKAIALGNEIYSFKAATINFYNKYDAIPGDMVDAYNIWGSMCAATSGDCNGDGDNQIDSDETDMALIHMALEELIAYGNINNTSYYQFSYPTQGELYYKNSTATVSERTYYSDALSRNILEVADGTSKLPFISADMAQKLDFKLDDGLPKTGDITAVAPSTNACIDATNNVYYDNEDGSTPSASEYECSFAVPISF